MAEAPPARQAAPNALAEVLGGSRGRLIAALIAELGDFDLAEEALSDAVESALVHWGRSGVPSRPEGWLLTVARRKAIDRLRRTARFRARQPDLEFLARADQEAAAEPPPDIPDERLRLIFTCCHPALAPKSQVALTLRTLGGLTTPEIARAFLDTESAMRQRLSRAKAKIRDARIPFQVPGHELWAERLHSVLAVIYLIFTEGHAASGDALIRVDLCEEALHLAGMLDALRPDEPEVMGLRALLLLTHSRRPARLDGVGRLVPLDRQDRRLWDRGLIAEGQARLDRAITLARPGPFQVKAAIAALHAEAPGHDETDWRQIALLYDSLYRMEPTAVVRLNRAAALADAGALAHALCEVEAMAQELADYQPFQAAHADLLARSGRARQAREAYVRAIALSRNRPERAFLEERMAALSQKKGRDKARPKSNREV